MARSDLIISLVKAGTAGNYNLFRKTVEAIIADERGKRHDVLADRLAQQLAAETALVVKENRQINPTSLSSNDLFYEKVPKRRLNELILNPKVEIFCRNLIEEQLRSDILKSYNLEPRHRLLLIGPPGNGKTSLAEALAFELMLPFITVRYEGLIGSYLGETASRLKRLFDYVKTRACVLFFDEFDTLGKERGDIHETGEIKRVVSSLLMQIDELPPHVVVVTATNHPELLDRAVWRRFQLRLQMPSPSISEIENYFNRMQKNMPVKLGMSAKSLAEKLKGSNFSELEEFISDVSRRYVLALPDAKMKTIVSETLKFKKYTSQIRK